MALPWREYNLGESSHFLSPKHKYMGTVSDIRSRKKDDIVGASHLFMSLNEEYEIRKFSFFSKMETLSPEDTTEVEGILSFVTIFI